MPSDIRERIAGHEEGVREIVRGLSEARHGWPASEADFAHLDKQVRELRKHLDMRAGLRGIEATS